VNKQVLEDAMIRSGWPRVWEDQLDGLWSKIQRLSSRREYQRLLLNIRNSNDKSNLVASILEVTFAYQFESVGIELDYEVKQDPSHPSSVDFRWKASPGLTVYIETRLLQQDKATTDSMDSQLRAVNAWSVAKDGDDERKDIIRVQQVILEKVQKEDGTPTKFFSGKQGTINIVSVDISQIILGMFDHDDCLLVGQGVQLAAADIKHPEDTTDTISSLIKKYLKAAGISFDQLTRKVEKWIDVEEDREVSNKKRELPPIEAVDPPTFIRWKFSGPTLKLYPGQRYSFVFETDASPSYWNPEDQVNSKIKVTAHAVRYVGSGEMKGGRVRCHFECPEDVAIGTKGFIQVQMEYALGAAKTSAIPVEVVEKPLPRTPPSGPKPEPEPDDEPKQTIKVKVRKKDFSEVEIPVVQPIPVTQKDNTWLTLGWPHDPNRVGFSIRSVAGKVHLYYNAEFTPFLDLKHRMSKKSLESEFIRRYEIKLVLHTIFTLNYDFTDEEEFTEDRKKRIRDLLCATAESLVLATKSELEIEAKLKSEDSAPLETAVAGNLQQVATLAQQSEP
jgi:hypothetical protein